MKAIIKWINEALAVKDVGLPAMTHYRIKNREICATNGYLTAAHPCPYDEEFLVSGVEFEKILARMDGYDKEPTFTMVDDDKVNIRCGRFHGTVRILPIDLWNYPGVNEANWLAIPDTLISVLKTLRAFISDNPSQLWAGCVALEHGNAYSTNNIAVAGCACPVGDIEALLPSTAIDFIMKRQEGLKEWAWTDNYVAFRWASGAWMRTQLVIGQFPERAAALVREAYDSQPTQEITEEFREAFIDIAEMAEDTLKIFSDHVESKFKQSIVEFEVSSEVPEGQDCSMWRAKFLIPVIEQATHWSPSMWPQPAPFRGKHVAGFVLGLKTGSY